LTETQGSRTVGQPPASPGDALARIVETKRAEAALLAGRGGELRRACADAPAPRDFAAALRRDDAVALIAEVKRRSPGAGSIRPGLDPVDVASGYERAGAAAISVLTDGPWFGGTLADLSAVRARVAVPVLRKDFTLIEEQVLEGRAAGADAVLLIVRILDDARLRGLRELAESLGMAALVEVHDAAELERALASDATVIGVNNRDLTTFRTSLDHTFALLGALPAGVTVVSESGIRTPADVERLGADGVHAVLVGEALLRETDPSAAAAALAGRPRRERARV
jgi:indole-3-glycerol phosphate synthase